MKLFVLLILFSLLIIGLGFSNYFRRCGSSFSCTSKLACCTCGALDCETDRACDQTLGLSCISGRCNLPADKQIFLRKSLADNVTTDSHYCNIDDECIDEAHCRDNKCTHNFIKKREADLGRPLKPFDCICVCTDFPELYKPCQKMLQKCIRDEDCASNTFCIDDQSENGTSRCTPLTTRI